MGELQRGVEEYLTSPEHEGSEEEKIDKYAGDSREIIHGSQEWQEVQSQLMKEIPEVSEPPFTYERTFSPEEANYFWERMTVVNDKGEEITDSDDYILAKIKKEVEDKQWYTSEFWRKKGLPQEQINFRINNHPLTIYNYNKDIPFTDEHLARFHGVIEQLARRFPNVLDKMKWVTVIDKQSPSALGDDEKYPTNGAANAHWELFQLLPRGMQLTPHRIEKTSNLEGTLTHESSHLIEGDFKEEWKKKFEWKFVTDFPEDWEQKEVPNVGLRWFNRQTGEMAPFHQLPLQPEQCVNYYAKGNMNEDIAESITAYIYDPELLRSVSPDKYEIIQRHDAQGEAPQIQHERVAKENIRLPEVEPKTIRYYIKEPSEEDNNEPVEI